MNSGQVGGKSGIDQPFEKPSNRDRPGEIEIKENKNHQISVTLVEERTCRPSPMKDTRWRRE